MFFSNHSCKVFLFFFLSVACSKEEVPIIAEIFDSSSSTAAGSQVEDEVGGQLRNRPGKKKRKREEEDPKSINNIHKKKSQQPEDSTSIPLSVCDRLKATNETEQKSSIQQDQWSSGNLVFSSEDSQNRQSDSVDSLHAVSTEELPWKEGLVKIQETQVAVKEVHAQFTVASILKQLQSLKLPNKNQQNTGVFVIFLILEHFFKSMHLEDTAHVATKYFSSSKSSLLFLEIAISSTKLQLAFLPIHYLLNEGITEPIKKYELSSDLKSFVVFLTQKTKTMLLEGDMSNSLSLDLRQSFGSYNNKLVKTDRAQPQVAMFVSFKKNQEIVVYEDLHFSEPSSFLASFLINLLESQSVMVLSDSSMASATSVEGDGIILGEKEFLAQSEEELQVLKWYDFLSQSGQKSDDYAQAIAWLEPDNFKRVEDIPDKITSGDLSVNEHLEMKQKQEEKISTEVSQDFRDNYGWFFLEVVHLKSGGRSFIDEDLSSDSHDPSGIKLNKTKVLSSSFFEEGVVSVQKSTSGNTKSLKNKFLEILPDQKNVNRFKKNLVDCSRELMRDLVHFGSDSVDLFKSGSTRVINKKPKKISKTKVKNSKDNATLGEKGFSEDI